MNSEKRRLIDAMAKSTGRMISRFSIPASDMDYMAATTVMGELLRRGDSARVQDLYASGHGLAQRLMERLGRDDGKSAEIAQFHQLPPVDDETLRYASAQDRLHALKKVLSALVARSGYPADPTGDLQDIISSLCQWEAEVLKPPAPADSQTKQAQDFKQSLESSARAQGGAFENAKVTEFTLLVGGFSNLTTLFKIADNKGEVWDLVARASTGLPLGIEGRDIDGEYFLLRYLHQRGLAIAEPLWLENNDEKYGAKFLVTRKLEGKTFGTVVEAQRLTSSQLRALATQLAEIHALRLDAAHPDLQRSLIDTELVGVSTREAVSNYLNRWIKLWRSTGLASPTIEAALQWLCANLPQTEEAPVLVHGDYALHNIMMQGDEISGVLDWELSHVGDSSEDIAGLLASFPNQDDGKEFIRHYIEAGGKAPTEFYLKYCNVFRYFIMYVVMIESELRFYSLSEVYPELLVLGSFVQTPAQHMAEAIRDADQAKARG